MKPLVLLEDYPSNFVRSHTDEVVALTPKACYGLARDKQWYRTVDQFDTEAVLRQREDAYWEGQLAWLDQIDAMLWQRIPALSARTIHPARLYGYYLKTEIDRFFIRALEAETVLDQGCDRVILWRDAMAQTSHPLSGRVSPGTINSMVWPLLCAHRGIAYEDRTVPSPMASGRRTASLAGIRAAAFTRGTRLARRGRWAVDGWRKHRQADRRLTLLFLDTDFGLSSIVSDAIRAGHRCLVLGQGDIHEVSPGGGRLPIGRAGGSTTTESAARWNDAAETLCAPDSPLWDWPRSWFQCSMAPLLNEELRLWISCQLPELVRLRDAFSDIYHRQRIDFTLTSAPTQTRHFAAIAACGQPKSTESVLIAHGEGMEACKSLDLFEMFPYQRYIVSDADLAAHFEQRKSHYDRATAQVHVASCRWPQYSRYRRRRAVYIQRWDTPVSIRVNRPPLALPKGRPVLVYLMAWPQADHRYLNHPDYSETWYYRFQRVLVEAFAKLVDYTVVIKPFLMQDTRWSAVRQHLDELRAENLYFSRAPFKAWLPWADRTILDMPSTGVYEAALSGVSFHLLVYRPFAVRPSCLEAFARWLTVFDEPEEAVEAVKRYLQAPADEHPVIQPEGPNVTTLLETLIDRDEARCLRPDGLDGVGDLEKIAALEGAQGA